MGRFDKSVFIENGIDRRELGYYATPEFVAHFMVDAMMKINPNGKYALDPCVGKEELIKKLYDHNIDIDGIDIYHHGDYYYCNFIQADFIELYRRNKSNLRIGQGINLKYDYIIANPPYNCHELNYIKDNKKSLGSLFGNIGIHNMYSMFISAIIDSAKEGSLISIISSDSFLTARAHNPLRKQILKTCTIHNLVLCPADLFWDQKADVRTCIMVLQKGKQYQNKIGVLNRLKNKQELKDKLAKFDLIEADINDIVNNSGSDDHEFIIDVPPEIQSLFSLPKIGDQFKCITGISTGKDLQFISKQKKDGFEVPFYKNPGMRKFFCEQDGYLSNDYLKHDKEIKNFMVRNKAYMLKEGITCSSMGLTFSACYLPPGSTFGVNANIFGDQADLWWLLAYLNSSLVTYMVRGVLCRSNMVTSGYVAKIPVIDLCKKTKEKLAEIAIKAFKEKVLPKENRPIIDEVDLLIFKELSFSNKTETEITHFAKNLQSRV
ncbi:N-6 DNA methylase [Mucilaginibacter phyllosphaerae]|uniref:site-specific DNA-methyltransferase (adenine-specific) n=1 Tax=Mucilaginibacter phyllosphaerae TaxID=1812349 RepID=A0A4Y8ADP4_9SPHI|nr:N-6 DNA methylase [Mucilaginibacter phyllosphaerae]MBB3970359.1 hypothetical protein [Mucilaginibacter phyllosphaerae]TEW66728.1 DNA methyltransferase [Mucilaginibacter phyllosphaerae]GGH11503.1 hypothetical protein GCM10007352_17800 [Mucilaginibacter phyllosphaerae]